MLKQFIRKKGVIAYGALQSLAGRGHRYEDSTWWDRSFYTAGVSDRQTISPMKDPLSALGMSIAFSPGLADFANLSDARDDLYISSVLQKTFVNVNEEGTEAAAATSVTVGVTSAPPSVRVDRPFLFAIRERLSGTILFVGAIVDPPSS